jgi:hypothetical protein
MIVRFRATATQLAHDQIYEEAEENGITRGSFRGVSGKDHDKKK